MLLFLLILSFFTTGPGPLHRYQIQGRAQGTTYAITYYATDSIVTKAVCDSVLRSLDSALSIYQSYSEINALNAAQRTYVAGQHLAAVLQKGKKASRQTGGAFDMTILPLVEAWGFGARPHTQAPDSATIKKLERCTSWRKLKLRGRRAVKKTPCLQVDVNGIAQGYSVDVLCRFLSKAGIQHYLVELGGELRVNGYHANSGAPFTIGIESPEVEDHPGAPLRQQVVLRGGALTTSGNYRRYYLSGNKAITHLLNPHTGFPVQNELISVTVWAPTAIEADALDNALMVMGLQKGLRFAEGAKKVEAYFIYKRPNGTPGDTATTGFYKMLHSPTR